MYASGINGFDAQYGSATDAEAREGVTLVNTLNCNLAACFLKQHKWERAISVTTRVIKSDPQHAKALYRRAVARIAIGDVSGAEIDALGALDLNPDGYLTLRRNSSTDTDTQMHRLGGKTDDKRDSCQT